MPSAGCVAAAGAAAGARWIGPDSAAARASGRAPNPINDSGLPPVAAPTPPANPVAMSLSHSADVAVAALDLRFHLFINTSSRDFLLGDDPVVLHNQFCEGIDHQGVLGWRCAGLQVALPISPRHLLFLYDTSIYKVDQAHKGKEITFIDTEDEIRTWNKLQILNCLENAYHNGLSKTARTECESMSSLRPKTRIRFVETNKVHTGGDGSKSLIHHYELMLPVRFSSRFVTLRKAARRIPMDQRASMYRDLKNDPRLRARSGPVLESDRYFIERVTER